MVFEIVKHQLVDTSTSSGGKASIQGITSKWTAIVIVTWRLRSDVQELKDSGVFDDKKVPRTMVDRRGREVGTTAFVGSDLLPRRRLPMRGAVLPVAAPAAGADLDYVEEVRTGLRPISHAPEGFIWVSEEITTLGGVGEEVDVSPGGGVMVSPNIGLALARGVWVRVRLVKVEEVPGYSEELRLKYSPSPMPSLEELKTGGKKEAKDGARPKKKPGRGPTLRRNPSNRNRFGGRGLNARGVELGVDFQQTRHLAGFLTDYECGVLQAIVSGGINTQERSFRHKNKGVSSPICPFHPQCGLNNLQETRRHRWWECPAWEHLRPSWFRDYRQHLDNEPACFVQCAIAVATYTGPAIDKVQRVYLDIQLAVNAASNLNQPGEQPPPPPAPAHTPFRRVRGKQTVQHGPQPDPLRHPPDCV
eukprot:Skav233295  [mRNA]  locus=scaffold1501:63075:68291:+ [translate_table: standard]